MNIFKKTPYRRGFSSALTITPHERVTSPFISLLEDIENTDTAEAIAGDWNMVGVSLTRAIHEADENALRTQEPAR